MTDLLDQGKKTEKNFQKASYITWSAIADLLNMSVQDLAKACGYSRTAVTRWKEEEEVPKVALLAAKGLAMETKKGKTILYIIPTQSKAQQELFDKLLETWNISNAVKMEI